MNWKSVGPRSTGGRNASRKKAGKALGLGSEGRKRQASSLPLSKRRKCSGSLPPGRPTPYPQAPLLPRERGNQSEAIGGVAELRP